MSEAEKWILDPIKKKTYNLTRIFSTRRKSRFLIHRPKRLHNELSTRADRFQ